jgi:hypothetical protein
LRDQVNGNIANPVATMQAQVNSQIVSPVDSMRGQLNSDTIQWLLSLQNQLNSIVGQLNSMGDEISAALSTVNSDWSVLVTYLSAETFPVGATSITAAAPGIGPGYLTNLALPANRGASASISPAPLSQSFPPVSAPIANVTQSFTSLSHGAGVPWSPVANVTTANVSWIPVGHSTPVPVTPAEAAAIMTGIAARTNSLQTVKVSKQAEVNALTTIASVIAYDVLAHWPAT